MYFFDTNVLVYAATNQDPRKQKIATELVAKHSSASEMSVSTQVLHEFVSVLSKKVNPALPRTQISALLDLLVREQVMPHTAESALAAFELQAELKCSWWDALVIEAALRSGAKILYSEDMQSKQMIKRKLKIVNPF